MSNQDDEQIKAITAKLEDQSKPAATDADTQALQAKIAALEAQLAAQKAAKPSILQRLVPNRAHRQQVVKFVQNNGVSLFAAAWLAVLLPQSAWWLILVTVIYYGYPLLSSHERFAWEARLAKWLVDPKVQLQAKQREQLKAMRDNLAEQTNKLKASVERPTPAPAAQPAAVHQPLFSNNLEFWFGLIMAAAGFVMTQFMGGGAFDLKTQLQSLLQNGGLSSDGYILIWSYVAARLGLMALIGGLVKGFLHKGNFGQTLKALAVLAAIACAGILTYVYAHPLDSAYTAAKAAYDNGMSLSDVGDLAAYGQYLPLAVMGVYALGIVINVIGRNRRVE